MPTINRSALVMYSSQAMFNLVNDIEQYPQFLPNCSQAKIITTTQASITTTQNNIINTQDSITAALEMRKGAIHKWFTTKNTLFPHDLIKIELVEGPFKQLEGQWHFAALNQNACKVSLSLHYEFNQKLVELAFGHIFKELTNKMISAFTERAKQVITPTAY